MLASLHVYAVHFDGWRVRVRRTLVNTETAGGEWLSTEIEVGAETRVPLTRERVLSTAVALADQEGIESLSMRKLAQALDVVPMALYRHVANKDELLDALVDVIVGEIDPPLEGADWKTALRARILSARRALLRHPWASRLMESRNTPTPVVLGYMDSMIGMFRTGGFSLDLTHHALHAMGSRMFGFTQELFNDSSEADPDRTRRCSARWPTPTRTSSRSRRSPTTTGPSSARGATTSSSSSSRST